jgi:predicted patatin/cPLA2 family phospholipase
MSKDQIVIERLLARRDGKKDKYKIGLVVEGGGMRGAFSGGVMAGLEELGLTECFDTVYASSSGSCAAAYFLSGQTDLGVSVYKEDLSNSKFIKPWKIIGSADIDYLCDVVFSEKKKLDTDKVKNSRTVLKIYTTDLATGNCTFITNKDNVDLIKAIKASCALPVFYNKPVSVNGKSMMDGRIGKALPVEDAIADGCTDILVVTNVPKNYREKRENLALNLMKKAFMGKLPSEYKRRYNRDRKASYNESLNIAFGKRNIEGVNIYTISPSRLYSKFEARSKSLDRIINQGITRAKHSFAVE